MSSIAYVKDFCFCFGRDYFALVGGEGCFLILDYQFHELIRFVLQNVVGIAGSFQQAGCAFQFGGSSVAMGCGGDDLHGVIGDLFTAQCFYGIQIGCLDGPGHAFHVSVVVSAHSSVVFAVDCFFRSALSALFYFLRRSSRMIAAGSKSGRTYFIGGGRDGVHIHDGAFLCAIECIVRNVHENIDARLLQMTDHVDAFGTGQDLLREEEHALFLLGAGDDAVIHGSFHVIHRPVGNIGDILEFGSIGFQCLAGCVLRLQFHALDVDQHGGSFLTGDLSVRVHGAIGIAFYVSGLQSDGQRFKIPFGLIHVLEGGSFCLIGLGEAHVIVDDSSKLSSCHCLVRPKRSVFETGDVAFVDEFFHAFVVPGRHGGNYEHRRHQYDEHQSQCTT